MTDAVFKANDSMGARIEDHLRGLILDSVAASPWVADKAYVLGDRIEPVPVSGRVYECIKAGRGALTQPRWPEVEGLIVSDGAVRWEDVGLSLTALKVVYRGEPGFVPTRLYPFSVVFLSTEMQATGQDGYGRETGIISYRYSGSISCEQYFKDVETLEPNSNREADIGSYREARELIQGCWSAITAWDPGNDIVWSEDGKEQTRELFIDTVRNSIMGRSDNFSNRGSFDLHIYSTRQIP